MARIESGKASLKIELGSYSELINSLNAVFEPSLKSKNLSYLCYNTVEHDAILCDRTKIREILLNIISNSIKYTPEGGKISVKIEETPAPRKGFASYRITVKDNGIGMSKEYLPHIFEEFTREHSSTESHITGTGLGLPIVKSLVNLMGGTIDVESELGAGTITTVCLTFGLPTEEQLAAHQHKDEILEQSLQTLSEKRVLLAEDNDLNAEIVLTVLEENGIHAEHVKDGALCLKAVQNAPEDYYNVILMDIQMPNMNGYQAAEAIRALPGKRGEIPIVAMTANAFEEDRRKALESGMNAHIAKPVDVSVLLETLSRFSMTFTDPDAPRFFYGILTSIDDQKPKNKIICIEKRSVSVKRTAPFFMRRSGRFYFSFFSSSRFLEISSHLCFTQSGDLCGSCGVLNR